MMQFKLKKSERRADAVSSGSGGGGGGCGGC